MKIPFRKYFIPHEENDFKPHFLRRDTVMFICLVALTGELVFLLGASHILPSSPLSGVILINALVDETNQNRIADNISMLRVDPLLQVAAQEKANDMAKNSYFAHTSPSGVTPWYWFQKVGYDFIYAGENLAVNFSDSKDVVDAWMNSVEHRANILNKNFTEIGIAMAQGEFNGLPAVYVVQLFGTPVGAEKISSAVPAKKVSAAVSQKPEVVTVSSSSGPTSQETFVAVKGVETQVALAVKEPPAVLENNPVQNAAANPRRVINGFYYLLIALFASVIVFNLFMKLHLHHPKLILTGTLVILVAASCIALNQYLMFFNAAIS